MMLRILTPLMEKRALRGGHVSLTFRHAGFANACRPGQFLTIRTSPTNAPLLRRPFGVHDVLGDEVRILVKVVGPGTDLLASAEPGHILDVLGPLGNGFTLPEKPARTLLVAGGIGVAPLLFTAKRLLESKLGEVRLYFGGATADDLVALDEFERLGVRVVAATEDGGCGRRGFVTAPLLEDLPNFSAEDTSILACGPVPMLKAVAEISRRAGMPCQVSLENTMACGVGSCMGCVTDALDGSETHCYKRVCREGPVFDARSVQWKEGA